MNQLDSTAGTALAAAGVRLAAPRTFATLCVLILAFLLASSPARNSDLWLHLATGRALANGDYAFGVEPFSYASADAYWVNPSWLYETILYVIYQMLGGNGLVILKGLAVVALAALQLSWGRSHPGSWLPEFATALALLALAPWLALKPIVLSFVFLAFTCWFLERKIRVASSSTPHRRYGWWSFVPLLVVFAIWANVDSWFFLGPAVVAFFAVGQILDRGKKKADTMARTAAIPSLLSWWGLVAASVLACLVNPHGIRIFQVPVELLASETGAALSADPFLHAQFFAPFREIYFSSSWYQYPAGVAFWVLTAMGLGSFFASADWSWRWPLLWAGFFCLGLWKGLAIPFFCVVAAPILARNLGALAERERQAPRVAAWTHAGFSLFRITTFVGIVLLVIAAWPGWLQLGPHGPRQWHVELDPGMTHAAEHFDARLKQGKSRDAGRNFAFSPEAGNYLAWLSPQVKSFTNSHLNLTPASATDFVTLRAGLAGLQISGDLENDWRTLLRRYQVNRLLVYAQNVKQILPVMRSRFPGENVLLFLSGKVAIFGWRDPDKIRLSESFEGLELDVQQAAFRGRTVDGPQPAAVTPRWWASFWQSEAGPSADRDEAELWLGYFDAWRPNFQRNNIIRAQQIMMADLAARGSSALAGAASLVGVVGNYSDANPWFLGMDDGPPGALYLALHRSRRAVALHPGDAEAHFILAKVLLTIGKSTRERSWDETLPLLGKIRTAQTLAALDQAVTLDPDHWQAHNLLANVYGSMGYMDLTLRHRRKSLEIQSGLPLAGETSEKYRERQAYLKASLEPLAKEVQKRRDYFELHFSQERVRALDRARAAGDLGLVGKALDILLAEHVNIFGAAGLEMEIKLLMNTGKLEQARRWLLPEHENLLGSSKYFPIKAQLDAAAGDLEQATENFAEAMKYRLLKEPLPAEALLPIFLGQTLLFEAGSPHSKLILTTKMGFPHLPMSAFRANYALDLVNRKITTNVVLALLEFEAGQVDRALESFQRAEAFWNGPASSSALSNPESATGHRIAAYFLEQFSAVNRQK